MEPKEIVDRLVWDGFLREVSEKTFLSSWEWGDFHVAGGGKIWRLGVYHGQKLMAIALVLKVDARRGRFLIIPHGPIIIPWEMESDGGPNIKKLALAALIKRLKEIAKQEKVSFIRIGPLWKNTEGNEKILINEGLRNAATHAHYETTWKLNIEKTEEEILAGMRKTTRYLIRQAEKNKDISIVKSENTDNLKLFNDVYMETVKRHHFTPFPKNYLKNEVNAFASGNEIEIFLGKFKNEVVAAAIIIYWQGIGFYHHGASLSRFNNNKTPISYLLQWEAIKEAKRRDCKLYDFWGVLSEKELQKKHPWAGFSQFKMGFGGERYEYVKTKDLPLSIWYYPTHAFEKIRKIQRRL